MSGYTNQEGYADPTVSRAMRNITAEERRPERKPFRPMVYICSPYSGDIERNRERTIKFCRYALDRGNIPVTPHLMFLLFMDDTDPKERDLAIFMDIILLGKCQELWVLGDRISNGMRKEITFAKNHYKCVRYFDDDFQEVRHP